jgi:hypothetical protein
MLVRSGAQDKKMAPREAMYKFPASEPFQLDTMDHLRILGSGKRLPDRTMSFQDFMDDINGRGMYLF